MSVVSVNHAFTGRGGSATKEGVRTYEQVWLVITDNRLDGPRQVIGDPRLPRLGQFYSYGNDVDAGALCAAIDPDQDEGNPLLWRVTVSYTSQQSDADENQDGIDFTPRVSWQGAQYQRVLDRDARGKARVNSTGEYFDPPRQIEDSRAVMVIDVNQRSFDESKMIYINAINSDTWAGRRPFQARCVNISASEQKQNGETFFSCQYSFQFNYDEPPRRVIPNDQSGGWISYDLDQGYYEIVNGLRTRILDDDKEPIAVPALLDGRGRKLVDVTQPVFIPFHDFRELPFNQLITL